MTHTATPRNPAAVRYKPAARPLRPSPTSPAKRPHGPRRSAPRAVRGSQEQSKQQECEEPEDPANGRSRHECSRPISHLATGASGRCRSRGSSHPKQELSSADCGRTIRQLRHAQDQIAPTNQAMTRPTIATAADRPGARCQAKNCSLGSPPLAATQALCRVVTPSMPWPFLVVDACRRLTEQPYADWTGVDPCDLVDLVWRNAADILPTSVGAT